MNQFGDPSVLCVVPARGGSKRLPRKNVADLCGKPMLAYTLEAAQQSHLFSQVYVSTEDLEIAAIASQFGGTIPYLRPSYLATDQVGVVDVCLHLLDHLEQQDQQFEVLCVLLPSSPLRLAEDIQATYQKMQAAKADYAIAVTTYLYPPWQALYENTGKLQTYWGEDQVSRRSQDVPPLWVDSGATYFARLDAFRRDRNFYGENLAGYVIPPERAIDVDTPFQFYLAQLLLRDRLQTTKP